MGANTKSGYTRNELKSLVRDTISGVIDEKIEQQRNRTSNWFQQIQATAGPAVHTNGRDRGPGTDVAKMLRSVAISKGDQERAYSFSKKQYGLDDRCTKALMAGDATQAGFIVPQELADEVIELLRPKSLVRRMGPRSLSPSSGSLDMPRLAVSAQTDYVAEGQPITTSAPTLDEVKITPRKLASIVAVTNELLAYGQDTESLIRDDLVRSIATTEDVQLMRGDGLASKPLGIRNWADANNVIAANASVSLDNVTSDLFQLLNALEGSDVPMPFAWLMSPRSKNYILSVRDSNGVPGFNIGALGPEGISLYGYPILTSNNIPNTLGGGTDSEVYLVSPSEVILAELPGMQITVSDDGTYTDGGELRSAFERDITLVRVTMRHDVVMRHPQSIAYLTGVTWQAA